MAVESRVFSCNISTPAESEEMDFVNGTNAISVAQRYSISRLSLKFGFSQWCLGFMVEHSSVSWSTVF